ncbi:helix-turn-helix domain-containing protein [Brevibacterium sp.]|uniref:winged helix-turn-helix transcriptional regulator n=1 Tax=Brevibacterium sp. TaxID=1701 RepID=UPI0025B83742|nr:helix-turn-helix domain-containing protein [Brevibacterium sp.]
MSQSVSAVPPDRTETLTVPAGKSGCPINMTVELLGDRWSFVVLRDIVFGGHRHFRELLDNSLEGIASNILAARLKKLTAAGLLSTHADPHHRQKIDYRLTEPAIQLIPLFAQLGAWGARWMPTTPELAVRAELLAAGGPPLWDRFMEELRSIHLENQPPPADGVLAELTAAHEQRRGADAVAPPRREKETGHVHVPRDQLRG